MVRSSLPALLLALAAPSPLLAQMMVQAVPGSTDADRLADQMRRLAVSPNDLDALVTAGELSLKLDDLGAAASFFTRAERVDPRSGRVKAGQGAILVHAERPGEALRYFAQAEALGRQPATFAADRGLALDLIGENDRAQRDYRLALRAAPDDETLRRYALSLGITGKRELAEQQLQPLLRKSDRGAWRARAFIEAMSGNLGEASRIATTMMPPGTAAGLQPFFERLPALGTVDRAFAVHFGNARSSPQRLADARLAPPMPVLAPDPTAPRLAAAAPVATAQTDRGKRKRGKDREAVAVAVAAPVSVATPLPEAPAYATRPGAQPVLAQRGQAPASWPSTTRPLAVAAIAPPVERRGRDESAALANAQAARLAPAPAAAGPTRRAPTLATVASARPSSLPNGSVAVASSAPITRAAVVPAPEADVTVAVAPAPVVRTTVTPAPSLNAAGAGVPTPPPVATGGALPPVVLASNASTPSASTPLTEASAVRSAPLPLIAPAPAPLVALPAQPTPEAVTLAEAPAVAPQSLVPTMDGVVTVAGTAPVRRVGAVGREVALAGSHGGSAAPATADARGADALAAVPSRAARRSRGTALASIVGDLPIPAAELGVRGRRQPAAADPQAEGSTARSRADRRSAAARNRPDADAEPVDPARAAADKRAADRKALADKKRLAEAKEAAAKKAEDAREAAEERKLARANPERIWVQVQGGAYKGDLPKAWAAVRAKGGEAFAGQTTGWTTPLRFTNRVLAGPFKSNEEARAFVNRLTAKGMGAFTFTSDAGQVVTRLPAK